MTIRYWFGFSCVAIGQATSLNQTKPWVVRRPTKYAYIKQKLHGRYQNEMRVDGEGQDKNYGTMYVIKEVFKQEREQGVQG